MGEYEISQKYTLEDLRQTAAREYRQEPTGNWILNRNGTRKQETIGKEYVPTRAGKIELHEWCKLMDEAVRLELTDSYTLDKDLILKLAACGYIPVRDRQN